MTVIFACTFPGGAAIAGDTPMHNPETNERVMNAPKVLSISQRVSLAQAGSLNGTGEVWTKLEQLPRKTATPTTIADAIRSFATPVYQWKSTPSAPSLCASGPRRQLSGSSKADLDDRDQAQSGHGGRSRT